MPNIGDLAGHLIGLLGDLIGSSTARLGAPGIGSILLVLFLLLALLARPVTRWTTRDLGRLATLPRSLAIAAEAGAGAAVSLGTAGIAVPLEVTTNDPVTAYLADALVAAAHVRTETRERAARSHVTYVGEGRATEAARALAGGGRAGRVTTGPGATHATSHVLGSVGEEGFLLMLGSAAGQASTTYGSADASQASSVLLLGEGTLVGPELFEASADLRPGEARAGVLAANRLIWAAVLVLLLGSVVQLLGWANIAAFLVGRA
ncbi:MAG: hypothetical protein E6I62_00500 [Chloroflexi bacterium]|nr:MAG: hypothetical protein E6I62_00500 [Chloroflexota bacterium]